MGLGRRFITKVHVPEVFMKGLPYLLVNLLSKTFIMAHQLLPS